jgi:hypothetical protein
MSEFQQSMLGEGPLRKCEGIASNAFDEETPSPYQDSLKSIHALSHEGRGHIN